MRAGRTLSRLQEQNQQEELNLLAAVLQTAGAPRPISRC
jgi:hypothetical protein